MSNHQSNIILRDFEIETTEDEAPSEEALFDMLCDRIAWMIEHNMEYLLSLLYRNDVEESKIHFALSPFAKEPANIELGKLVMERQKQRMATKKEYGEQSKEDVDDELRW